MKFNQVKMEKKQMFKRFTKVYTSKRYQDMKFNQVKMEKKQNVQTIYQSTEYNIKKISRYEIQSSKKKKRNKC